MPICHLEKKINIYYEHINISNSKSCFLLIGGLTRDHSVWRKIVPLLEKNHQVIIFDNRDSGQSSIPNENYDIAEMADDVKNFLYQLNYYPVHVVGHSMGGFIAIHLAAKYPELIKSLTLCSTTEKQEVSAINYINNRLALVDQQLSENKNLTMGDKKDILAALNNLYAAENLQIPEFVEEILSHETNHSHPQKPESFKRQALACISHDASLLVKKISCPTLVLTGEKDKFYTPKVAEKLANKIPHAKLAIIAKAAHMLQLEQPQELVKQINSFLVE